jgi:hypothetical protein
MAGGSAPGPTTAASPSALESVTGSRRIVTTRLAGMTRVCSSTTTSRVRRERLLRVLPFVCFFFFVGIQTSNLHVPQGTGIGVS